MLAYDDSSQNAYHSVSNGDLGLPQNATFVEDLEAERCTTQ